MISKLRSTDPLLTSHSHPSVCLYASPSSKLLSPLIMRPSSLKSKVSSGLTMLSPLNPDARTGSPLVPSSNLVKCRLELGDCAHLSFNVLIPIAGKHRLCCIRFFFIISSDIVDTFGVRALVRRTFFTTYFSFLSPYICGLARCGPPYQSSSPYSASLDLVLAICSQASST